MKQLISMLWKGARLFLAALFAYICTVGIAIICLNFDGLPRWATPLLSIGLLGVLIVAALFLAKIFGLKLSRSRQSLEQKIAELDKANLVERKTYCAKRAFAVEEFEDEGPHYFIELNDGRTLYLNGQYLYDYELIEDEPEFSQPRTFPCTEFEILWHRTKHYPLKIICKGVVIEPEITTPSFTPTDYKNHRIPEDGDIISNRSYDELKAERLKKK